MDFADSPKLRELNDQIRARMVGLLIIARQRGDLPADTEIDTSVLACRAFVYGLARMFGDGHYPEWQPVGPPAIWMDRALADFIQRLRRAG